MIVGRRKAIHVSYHERLRLVSESSGTPLLGYVMSLSDRTLES